MCAMAKAARRAASTVVSAHKLEQNKAPIVPALEWREHAPARHGDRLPAHGTGRCLLAGLALLEPSSEARPMEEVPARSTPRVLVPNRAFEADCA